MTSLVLKEHEVTDVHTWDWATLSGATVESSVTDPATKITTTVYKWEWATVSVHNGSHLLRAEVDFAVVGADPVQETKERSVTVKNLVVSASPEFLMYRPDDENPANTISYTLADTPADDPDDNETQVTITIYTSGQEQVKSETVTKTAPGTYDYVWDGKDSGGNLMEKGVYLYRISASQPTQGDSDCEKSDWGLLTSNLIIDIDQGTAELNYRVTTEAGCDATAATDARVRIYDPDLFVDDDDLVGEPSVNTDNQFTDLQEPFDKSGEYIFLVSARDKHPAHDRNHCDRSDGVRPLLQNNNRATVRNLAVMLDPGHGAVMNEGDKKYRGGNSTDPAGIVPVMYEANNVLAIASKVKGKLGGKRYVRSVEMTRTDEWDIGPKDKTDATVGPPDRDIANRERVEKLKRFIQSNYGHEVVFLSIHTNAAVASGEILYDRHGCGEVNPTAKTILGSYILALLTCKDPTITRLKYAGPWIQGNLVLNEISRIPDDASKKLRPVPASLIEVAFHTNWEECTQQQHQSFGCPRQPADYWLEAKRLRDSDFQGRVAFCYEDALWCYWAIEVNKFKAKGHYPCLTQFTYW